MVENLPANPGDAGSILELGRSPGVRNGNPVLLHRKFHGQKRPVGYSPQGRTKLDTTVCTLTPILLFLNF